MASKNKAELTLSATDKTAKAFKAVDKNLSLTQKKAKGLDLGLKQLTRGLGGTTRGLTSMLGPAALATTAVLGLAFAFTKAISSSIEAGDKIDKSSKKIGFSAENYQIFGQALKFSGVEMATVETAVLKMNEGIGKATQGTGEARIAFQELGLSLFELDKLSPEDAFITITREINKVESATKRAALTSQVFGMRGGKELTKILGENSEAWEENLEAVTKNANFMSNEAVASYARSADNVVRLKQAMAGLAATIRTDAAPIIEDLTSLLVSLIGTVDKAVTNVSRLFNVFKIKKLEGDIAIIENRLGMAFNPQVIDDYEERLGVLQARLRELKGLAPSEIDGVTVGTDLTVTGKSNAFEIPDDLFASMEDLIKLSRENNAELDESLRNYEGLATTGVPTLELLARGVDSTSIALRESTEALDGLIEREQELTQVLDGLNKQQEEAGGADLELQKLIDEIQKEQLANLRQQEVLRGRMPAQIDQIAEAQEKLREEIKQTNIVFDTGFRAGGLLLDNLSDGIGGLIDGTKTLKEAMKDFALSFLADIAKMIAQQLILLSLQQATAGFAGGGGFLGGIASAFGGGKAEGGPVSVGKTFLVGEKGPELFTPNQSGNIIPNSKMGGGGDTVVNIEVINNSSQPVNARMTTEQGQDGEASVTRVILTDLRNSGAISRGIGQRFGLAQTTR